MNSLKQTMYANLELQRTIIKLTEHTSNVKNIIVPKAKQVNFQQSCCWIR